MNIHENKLIIYKKLIYEDINFYNVNKFKQYRIIIII